jgi:hypothetical protein
VAVSTKGRRKLVVGRRLFLWEVNEIFFVNEEGALMHVLSQDKLFIVRYGVTIDGVTREGRKVTVIGREFPGAPEHRSVQMNFECPNFESQGAITPGGVRKFVEWCLSPDKQLVQIDWRGNRIGTTA